MTLCIKKQMVVARSRAEAEFRGMAHGVRELFWIQIKCAKVLRYQIQETYIWTYIVITDNTSVIEIAHNLVQHDLTKHVEVNRYVFFIKENFVRKVIRFPYTEE